MDCHSLAFLSMLLLSALGCCADQKQALKPGNLYSLVGQNVSFVTTIDHVTQQFVVVTWTFNSGSHPVTIISAATKGESVPDAYKDRVVFNRTTGSLVLKAVTTSDSGDYSINMVQDDGVTIPGEVKLTVMESVSDVVVKANVTNPVEFNDTVSLTCTALGSELTYSWLSGGAAFVATDHMQLNQDGTVLTILNILRSDKGPFACTVSNTLTNKTSSPLTFNISYGPEEVLITDTPQNKVHSTGSNITLTCSAESSPTAQFEWLFNGEDLKKPGPVLKLADIQESQSGSYTCLATNTDTKRYLPSGVAKIVIMEPVSDVVVTPNVTNPVEFNDTVSLTCTATGSEQTYSWLSGGAALVATDRMQLSQDGTMLTILNILRSDKGPFACTVSNNLTNKTSSPLTFNISYGPEEVLITDTPKNNFHSTGSNITLTCSAESSPTAQFEWLFNGEDLKKPGPVLKLADIQESQSGNYTCLATNTDTKRYLPSGVAKIVIMEPVSDVVVKANVTNPVEFNDTVSLTCTAMGSELTYSWLSGDAAFVATDHMQLSQDGTVLTILNILRSDKGPFACTVSNPLSNKTSSPLTFNISYGPEKILITDTSQNKVHSTGSNITLTCSAESSPAAQFEWLFNGEDLKKPGPVIKLADIQESQSGNYTCLATNTDTKRYLASGVAKIVLMENISGVAITGPTAPLIAGNSSANISCQAAKGTIVTIKWLKDGKPLSPSDRVTISSDKSSVDISIVEKSDEGEYQCEVSNPVSTASASYKMTFNSAYLNSGKYECVASNNMTGRNASAVLMLSVKANIDDPQPSVNIDDSLSGGAIAGIVIAVLVALLIISAIGSWMTNGTINTKKDSESPY